MELLKVKTVSELRQTLRAEFTALKLATEKLAILQALNRILARDVVSEMNVPHFNRSVVDGYAVKLTDVQGASESIPGFVKIIGQAKMGQETKLILNQGETVYVPTGGMVPQGTEAMIMIEYTEKMGDQDLAIYTGAGLNENMMLIGDDVQTGQVVLKKGHQLRPQDIGVLSAIGCLEAEVFKKLRIGIISTGDEVVKPGENPKPGEIIDINTPALTALALNNGFDVAYSAYVHDSFDDIKNKIEEGLKTCDLVVLSGGSSMGEKDYTVKVIEELGEVYLHGLSVKPGKPTILGKAQGKPVIGLPGQPAAAVMVFSMMIGEFNQLLYGEELKDSGRISGLLMENLHAAPGRRTFQTVKIKETAEKIEVWPTYGKSGMITLLSDSHGYVEMGENEEGLNAGEQVEVILF